MVVVEEKRRPEVSLGYDADGELRFIHDGVEAN